MCALLGELVYNISDTENTHEMKVQKDIDGSFLPMNQIYTMLRDDHGRYLGGRAADIVGLPLWRYRSIMDRHHNER